MSCIHICGKLNWLVYIYIIHTDIYDSAGQKGHMIQHNVQVAVGGGGGTMGWRSLGKAGEEEEGAERGSGGGGGGGGGSVSEGAGGGECE